MMVSEINENVPTIFNYLTNFDNNFPVINQQILQNVNQSWQTLANPSNTVDYSSHLLSATLPISIQHFLKYSETIKKETSMGSAVNGNNLSGMDTSGGFNLKSDLLGLKNGVGSNLNLALSGVNGNAAMQCNTNMNQHHNLEAQNTTTTTTSNAQSAPTTTTTGKKKKKKAPKEKKPRPKPGEIRETKALDGSPLFCCPECQMAYPDRVMVEQHVVSHAVERRFVCDICNAALKRKDHLTRHKLSHIPDRPHVCNVSVQSIITSFSLTD